MRIDLNLELKNIDGIALGNAKDVVSNIINQSTNLTKNDIFEWVVIRKDLKEKGIADISMDNLNALQEDIKNANIVLDAKATILKRIIETKDKTLKAV